MSNDLAANGSLKVLWDSHAFNIQFLFNKLDPPVMFTAWCNKGSCIRTGETRNLNRSALCTLRTKSIFEPLSPLDSRDVPSRSSQ